MADSFGLAGGGPVPPTAAEHQPHQPRRQARPAPRTDRPDGYADPALLAGRPTGTWIYLLALVVAAAADVAAFQQIISLVMPTSSDLVTWVLVFGFTGVALFLGHFAGASLADWVHRRSPAAKLMTIGCLAVWLALGLAAFSIRLLVSDPGAGGVDLSGTGAGNAGLTDSPVAAAMMFLCLYLSTGMVAIVGAYKTNNPLLSAYRRATKSYHRQVRRVAEQAAQHRYAEQLLEQRRNEAERDREARAAAYAASMALRDELIEHARLRMAHRLQDPAATDGLLRGARDSGSRDGLSGRPGGGPSGGPGTSAANGPNGSAAPTSGDDPTVDLAAGHRAVDPNEPTNVR